MLVHSAAFTCEAALVAVTLLKLFTEAQDPRFAGSDAAAVRQYRINVGVTAVSFAFTAVAFVGTVAGFGSALARLRGAVRRISEGCTGLARRRRSHAPVALPAGAADASVPEPLQSVQGKGIDGSDAERTRVDTAQQPQGSDVVPHVEGAVVPGEFCTSKM